jgi:DNA-binding NarL/FixJ family response regulator
VIRVLLVDDQQLVREGLRRVLRPRAGFEIVGECADGDEVVDAVSRSCPDVVVMDIRMPRVDGAEATRRLRSQGSAPPVLVLTTFDDDEVLAAALHAGADGFQLKDAPGEDLIRAVRAVAGGDGWLDPTVTARVLASYRRHAPRRPHATVDLTPRELDVLRLVAAGLTNREIALRLFISEPTVKTHLGHILTKLDLRDRPSAIVYAYEHGLVQPID